MSDPGEEPEEDLLSYSVSEDEELQQYEQEQADAAEALSAQVGGSTVPLQHTPRAQSGDCSGQRAAPAAGKRARRIRRLVLAHGVTC